MAAVTWVELVHVVDIFVLLKVTKAPELNFAPVTMRLNAGPPAVALLGESCEIVGVVPEVAGMVEWEP
jgi:hypothetical protein